MGLRKELERVIMEKIGADFQKSLEKVKSKAEGIVGEKGKQMLDKYLPKDREQTD